MEFGIIIQSPVFGFDREADPELEHHSLMDDIEMSIAADRAGFKYVWAAEHHFLDEYSHLSANSVVLAYLAHATERIHLGSGIFNPLPAVNHPAKVAEVVAMLDHVSEGRFEFGSGRGAGSHEILGFLQELGMEDLSRTREIWEDVIREFAKMWTQEEYQGYQGKYWSLPPRKVLPKPWGKPHPPMWYAAGNTSSYEMAARYGLGVLGFSVGTLADLDPVIKAYKGTIGQAEPVGAYVNDNIVVVAIGCVDEDDGQAVATACSRSVTYLYSQTLRYHDTFPHPPEAPYWPEVIPPFTPDDMAARRDSGFIIGDPDHALEQARRWEAAGCDQLVMATAHQSKAANLEMIRLMGEHVIPKIDRDPMHRTTRFREQAAAR